MLANTRTSCYLLDFSCAGLQDRKTMQLYASEFGHEESVRALIEKGASLEAVDKVRHFQL